MASTGDLPFQKPNWFSERLFSPISIGPLRISFGTLATPGAVLALSLPHNLCSSSWVKSFSHRTIRELRSCLWIDATYGNKLRTMYSSRSRLFRPLFWYQAEYSDHLYCSLMRLSCRNFTSYPITFGSLPENYINC